MSNLRFLPKKLTNSSSNVVELTFAKSLETHTEDSSLASLLLMHNSLKPANE
jgi:hypothetical protein